MHHSHRQSLWLIITVFVLSLLNASAATAETKNTVFPKTQWERSSPQAQGVDGGKLHAAIGFLEQHSGTDGIRELLIVRNGYVVWEGEQIDKVHGIWSGTKSFTSTCLGLLIEDGHCTLNSRAAEFVPEMSQNYSDVTLRHFTTMTSGYRAHGDEPRGSYTHGPSQTPFIPGGTPLFNAGTHYAYWDSAMNQFAHVLTVIADQSLESLFRKRIAEPIGMNPSRWRWGVFEGPEGRQVNGGAGNSGKHIQISASELARLGWLFLNQGRWDQRQIINAEWVKQATSVQVPANIPLGHPESNIVGPGVYGFNWWRNGRKADGTRKWPGAPASTYSASGYNNNDLFMIPDWNMVVVRLGLDERDHKISDQEYGNFLNQLGQSISGQAMDNKD